MLFRSGQIRIYFNVGAFNSTALHLGIRFGVNLGCFNMDMAEKVPNIDQIYPCLQHMHRFGVSQNVWGDFLGQIRVRLSGGIKILFQDV